MLLGWIGAWIAFAALALTVAHAMIGEVVATRAGREARRLGIPRAHAALAVWGMATHPEINALGDGRWRARSQALIGWALVLVALALVLVIVALALRAVAVLL